jgi:cytochrome P450
MQGVDAALGQKKSQSRPRLPPGPPPRDTLLSTLRYYYRFWNDSIGVVSERFATFGDIYYAPSHGVGLYVLRHPDHLWEVLVRDGAKYGKSHSALERLETVLGRGLLTTDGDEWRRARRMAQPAFSAKRLVGYSQAMMAETAEATAGWYGGQVRNMGEEMMQLTLRIVCRTLFGHDVRGQIHLVADAMKAATSVGLAVNSLPRLIRRRVERRIERATSGLDALIATMIARRRAGALADPPDLLQMLVAARDDEGDGGGLSDTEIRDHLVTFFLAGHETTSHALTWTWYLLGRHPEVEARLHS